MGGWMFEGLVALVVVLIAYILRKSSKDSKFRTPPCLPCLPIVGSLPFLKGGKNLHVVLTELSKKYGNVYGLYLGKKYYVVLNDHDSIREALVKKSLIFSNRGKLAVDGIAWTDTNKGIILSVASPAQRETRQGALAVLKAFGYGSRKMEEKIHMEAYELLEYIHSRKGEAWYPGTILERVTFNIIYNLLFGSRIDYDDPLADYHTSNCHTFADSADALYDVFPLLLHLPNVKRHFKKCREKYNDWRNFLEKKVDETLKNAKCDDNFASMYVSMSKETVPLRDLTIVIRDLILGGTETTSGQLNWALILLANHPEVQSKVQQEIDSVVPRSRFPSLDDKPNLPYLDATVLEILRLKVALPISVPRSTMAETEVAGYHIPNNAEVLINLWAIHMNPKLWDHPEEFRPERFLDENGVGNNREMMIAFSLGKRSCPGEVLARQEMFLLLSAMIQHFTVLPPEGEDKVKDEAHFKRTLTAEPHTLRMVPRVEK